MATVTAIKSVCPKCGKEGTQSIFAPKKNRPDMKYLRFIHSHGESHFIGRVRSEGEFMGEMNRPETSEDCQRALLTLSKEIRDLVKSYSPNTAVRMNVISPKLLAILEKFGY
jgi:hypothetical protein